MLTLLIVSCFFNYVYICIIQIPQLRRRSRQPLLLRQCRLLRHRLMWCRRSRRGRCHILSGFIWSLVYLGVSSSIQLGDVLWFGWFGLGLLWIVSFYSTRKRYSVVNASHLDPSHVADELQNCKVWNVHERSVLNSNWNKLQSWYFTVTGEI